MLLGIFLGFSILQVTQILVSAISSAQKYLKEPQMAMRHTDQQVVIFQNNNFLATQGF